MRFSVVWPRVREKLKGRFRRRYRALLPFSEIYLPTATEWSARCMQNNRLGDIDPFNPTSAAEKLAVMVWIQGGSNLNGAGSQPEYDGARLAARAWWS